MKLLKFLHLKKGTGTDLAKVLKTSPAYVSRIATGSSTCSPKRAVSIEKFTGGMVMRWDLRRDWKEIWPELTERDDAPGRRKANRV